MNYQPVTSTSKRQKASFPAESVAMKVTMCLPGPKACGDVTLGETSRLTYPSLLSVGMTGSHSTVDVVLPRSANSVVLFGQVSRNEGASTSITKTKINLLYIEIIMK